MHVDDVEEVWAVKNLTDVRQAMGLVGESGKGSLIFTRVRVICECKSREESCVSHDDRLIGAMWAGFGVRLLELIAEKSFEPHELPDFKAIRNSLNPASWNSLTKTSNLPKSIGASGAVCIFPHAKFSGNGFAICSPIGARS